MTTQWIIELTAEAEVVPGEPENTETAEADNEEQL